MLKEYTHSQEVLTRAYNHFNARFANNELKDALITVQSVGRKRYYGWFAQSAWRDRDGKSFHEINIGAEHFLRSNEDILETLLHEMAHLYNHQNGIDDCTPTQYHKKAFAATAKKFGLNVEKMGRFGYAKTSLNEQGKSAIADLKLDDNTFSIFRSFGNTKKQKQKKYITVNIGIEYKEKLDEIIASLHAKNAREAIEELLQNAETCAPCF